jgi:hypothetical protein
LKTIIYTLAVTALFTGCAEFTFEPESTPPETELDQVVQAQQEVMTEQEDSALNK